jgi:hypothetical protein
MRTVNAEVAESTTTETNTTYKGQTFSAKLKDGREITIREMKGSDLIYMEEDLGKYGETRKSFYLIERLNVGSQTISFDEIADLGINDIKTISDLIAKANGSEEDSDSKKEDPK